jgi:hypothetical protein
LRGKSSICLPKEEIMESAVIEQNNDDGALILSVTYSTPLQPLNVSPDAREAFLRAQEHATVRLYPASS